MKIFFTLITLFISSFSFAQIRSLGHNLSHTDYMIDSCTIGIQAVGCGNGKWTLATSPFLYTFYNMHNLYYRFKLNDMKMIDNSFEVAYFKTFNDDKIPDKNSDSFLDQVYKMEAIWLYNIISINMYPGYKMHINTNLNYYIDDERPFSLRRPTIKRNPFQLNLTTLHEVKMTKRTQVLGEFGVLHLLDEFPRIHMGASFVYKTTSLLFQLGFTFTTTFNGLFVNSTDPYRIDYQQYLLYQENGYDNTTLAKNRSFIKQDFSIHPEVSIQYLF